MTSKTPCGHVAEAARRYMPGKPGGDPLHIPTLFHRRHPSRDGHPSIPDPVRLRALPHRHWTRPGLTSAGWQLPSSYRPYTRANAFLRSPGVHSGWTAATSRASVVQQAAASTNATLVASVSSGTAQSTKRNTCSCTYGPNQRRTRLPRYRKTTMPSDSASVA
jgi:hypothetical protein